ncbi:alpha/beta hydrolase [Streptomyces sp. SBT349]|uniref:alpha/beta hydrolase n=1 Tax=Streptomyces sp. SBT349 TaxID=1580539 RepID=UPI00066B66D8|nr:alpha/beta fold hydrolase [Streptomyces sp. SBT349]
MSRRWGPPLPERHAHCAGLPDPFARPQLDHHAPSFALTPQGPVVSSDAWSQRRLAILRGHTWQPVTADGWHREPRWAGGQLFTLAHGRSEQSATGLAGALPPGPPTSDWLQPVTEGLRLGEVHCWDGSRPLRPKRPATAMALDPRGEPVHAQWQETGPGILHWGQVRIALPPGARVQDLAVSDDSRLCVISLRSGQHLRTLCLTRQGKTVGPPTSLPVTGHAVWVSPSTVALLVSTWPSVHPTLWNPHTGSIQTLNRDRVGVAETLGAADDGQLAFSWTTPDTPRHLRRAATDAPDPPPERRAKASTTRQETIQGHQGPLPCLVQDPPAEPRGTVVLFHGGPNGAHYATWSALGESLTAAGWRVVRPNLQGSRILDTTLAPGPPSRYGAEDVDDACLVTIRLGRGTLVVAGHSYGGYIASRVAQRLPVVRGAVLISGFLRITDLKESPEKQVGDFLHSPRVDPTLDPPHMPRTPHFVIHGDRDTRIPVAAMRRRSEHLPAGSEYVELPGEPHGLTSDTAARAAIPRLFTWLDKR